MTNELTLISTYHGVLTHDLVSDLLEDIEGHLESEFVSKGLLSHISIIYIELYQNMMNYSKNDVAKDKTITPYGFIQIQKHLDQSYILSSKNIVSNDDKERILSRLLDIVSLDREGIKKRYKELRRSAKNTHAKGAGIGLYDIAKRCDKIEYNFEDINQDKFYFSLTVEINL